MTAMQIATVLPYRALPSLAAGLMRTRQALHACLPAFAVIQPGFQQLPPQSNPSQYCVMVYCTSSRLSADQLPAAHL